MLLFMSQDNSMVATSEMSVLPKLVDFKGPIHSLCSCTDSAFTKSCFCEVYVKDELDVQICIPLCPALHTNWTPETSFRISSSFHCCTYFQKSKKHNKVVYLISQQKVLWSAYPGYSSVSYSGIHSPHICVF